VTGSALTAHAAFCRAVTSRIQSLQIVGGHRLGQMEVEACGPGTLTIFGLAISRDGDEAHVRHVRVLPQGASHVVTAYPSRDQTGSTTFPDILSLQRIDWLLNPAGL
jgi:hypothetical protein